MKKRIAMGLMALIVGLTAVGCGGGGGYAYTGIPIKMLTFGWIGTPIQGRDPYREWIDKNYGLNISLNASLDFTGDATIAFASNDKPDLIVFPYMSDFQKVQKSGDVLIDDWTPYLSKMPNMQRLINADEADGSPSIGKKMMTTADGKLQALYTAPKPPTYSLKVREDWANEYRATTQGGTTADGKPYPAGATATKGNPWQPESPDDLIAFARWIKATKPGCYCFTSSGERKDFGTLGHWIPLMWGPVNIMPWGIYLENDEPQFGTLTGNHEKMLNFMRQIVDEELVDPDWYNQTWDQKTKTREGKIGMEWYPGVISQETEEHHAKDGISTLDWWKTYDLPVAPDASPEAGKMPLEGYVGYIITVSKKAALNAEKMDRICKFINDVTFTYDATAEGKAKYNRPAAYDALRWGIGIEPNARFQEIPGEDYVYICTRSPEGTPDSQKDFRETKGGEGAWDWGAWFSQNTDGVISGNTAEVTAVTMKVIEHNLKTAAMETRVQEGSALKLDVQMVADITKMTAQFEYQYVTRATEESYSSFLSRWKKEGKEDFGLALLAEAKVQFQELGIL